MSPQPDQPPDDSERPSADPPGGAAGDTLSAREAAAYLDVKLATLYAYTSRGLVRSIPGDKGRARRYLRVDLERLRVRKEARSGHAPVAAAALRFGEPVLDTSITEISPADGPLYRGRPAIELAEADTPFELVAELLWTGELASPQQADTALYFWSALPFGMPAAGLRALLPAGLPPVVALTVAVPLLAVRDPGRFVDRPDAVLPRARHLVRRMATALALDDPAAFERAGAADSVAGAVTLALGGTPEHVAAVNRALVLCADHELNASAFAARVAASTGADLYSCIEAALAALCGPRHGGAADRVEALVRAIPRPEDAERVVHERARRGESVEGFGHPLYPEGDPRGRALVALAREQASGGPGLETCLALIEAMEGGGQGRATIDVGLVALARALGLRPGAAVGLFAIGRCVGWSAHVLEQYEAGYLLRPRARYLAEG